MGKGMYIGVDSKARKVKKMYVGVDGKARKVKKVYVGDANGKARLCWSGELGLYLFTMTGSSYTSSDGINYTKSTVEKPDWFHRVVYALGKFWALQPGYSNGKVYTSSDGVNWTLVSTIPDKTYFNSNTTFRYQNGVFIAIGIKQSSSYNNMAVSTDGINWTCANFKCTNNSSFTYERSPLDIRYGTIGGVTGWYVCTAYASSPYYIEMSVFKTFDELKSGSATYLHRYYGTATNSDGRMVIRNNKAYIVYHYYTGNVGTSGSNTNLISYNGASYTDIKQESNSYALGTVWSTDQYIIFRNLWQTAYSTTHLLSRYNFATETYSTVNSIGFHQGKYAAHQGTGVFVNGRMYQAIPQEEGYDTYTFYLQGAYSDNYGASVTRFVIDSTDFTAGGSAYSTLVYGGEGGGFHQEVY
jgi:hypothetical protein